MFNILITQILKQNSKIMFLSHFKLCLNHDLDDETGTQVSGYQSVYVFCINIVQCV